MKRIFISSLLTDKKLKEEFYNDMQNGAVSIIPTDTLYGFAVDASIPRAVEKIYSIKKRNHNKPLILFISALNDLAKLPIKVNQKYLNKLEKIWPNDLTVITKYINKENKFIKDFCFKTIGLRMPKHAKLLQLLNEYPGFFMTTSANRSECIPLLSGDEIEQEFQNEVDWLIEDNFYDKIPIPSTIIDITKPNSKILREGKQKFDI